MGQLVNVLQADKTRSGTLIGAGAVAARGLPSLLRDTFALLHTAAAAPMTITGGAAAHRRPHLE